MAVGTPSTDRPTVWPLLKGAVYLLVLAAIVHSLHNLLPNPFSATLLGAVVVSLAASRAGLPEQRPPAARMWLRAALVGPLLAGLLLALGLALGAPLSWSAPGLSLLFGVVEAGAGAYRNELWLRGIPLFFARQGGVNERIAAPYLVLVALAAAALSPGRTLAGMVLVAAAAAFFTLLWLRAGNSWLVVAAHGGWLFVSDGLLAGELVSLGGPIGRVASGAGAAGAAAWTAAIGFALLTALAWRILPVTSGAPEGALEDPEDQSA